LPQDISSSKNISRTSCEALVFRNCIIFMGLTLEHRYKSIAYPLLYHREISIGPK
jgi:hypothetical protein